MHTDNISISIRAFLGSWRTMLSQDEGLLALIADIIEDILIDGEVRLTFLKRIVMDMA